VRELFEETGLRARVTGLFGVYAGFDDPRVRAVLILYTAERIAGRLRPGDDAIEARFWPIARLPRRIAFAAHRRALAELHEGWEAARGTAPATGAAVSRGRRARA
jgi:ADP-ribose pyrophosphatase YjhB (NUDIX family)